MAGVKGIEAIPVGSALLSFYIMQAKLEVAVSKEREGLADLRAVAKEPDPLRAAGAVGK